MSVEGGDGGETSIVSRQGDSTPVELPQKRISCRKQS